MTRKGILVAISLYGLVATLLAEPMPQKSPKHKRTPSNSLITITHRWDHCRLFSTRSSSGRVVPLSWRITWLRRFKTRSIKCLVIARATSHAGIKVYWIVSQTNTDQIASRVKRKLFSAISKTNEAAFLRTYGIQWGTAKS